MFKRKPTIKDATIDELFAELSKRLNDSKVWIGDIKLITILTTAPHLLKLAEEG